MIRRPQWWISLASRIRELMGSESEPSSNERPHARTSDDRARFWEDFRAGQREADQRGIDSRKPLTPCPENGTPK